VKKQIIDKINELHEIQLPQVMVKSEIDVMKQQMLQQFQMYGGGGNDSSAPDLPDDMFKEEAEKRVSVGLIMRQIVSEGDMQPDSEKVKSKIEEIASQYPEPEKVINFYYGNHEQLRQIENSILEDQAIDSVVEKANIVELETTYEDVMAGRALGSEVEEN
ncbi:MAG: trigger factor, partial [Gammaproteobacteria bacterium]|nr:trigger factor [Gammaproteobacteria bacterium]